MRTDFDVPIVGERRTDRRELLRDVATPQGMRRRAVTPPGREPAGAA